MKIVTPTLIALLILGGCASQPADQDTAPAGEPAATAEARTSASTEPEVPVDADDAFVDDELDEFAAEFENQFVLEENDPFENFNRKVYAFNDAVDRAVLRPVARGYRKIMPRPARTVIRNFLSNLREPWTILNDFLQGKVEQGVKDTARFLFNTSFGVFGLFDFSTMAGLPRHNEDLGQTLAVWGVPEGPFLMLPLLGPSSPRDAGAFAARLYTNNLYSLIENDDLRLGVFILDFVELRATLLRIDPVLEQQLDPYLFLRDSYRQDRINKINDGAQAADEPY